MRPWHTLLLLVMAGAGQAAPLPVFPQQAAKLRPIELADLVKQVIAGPRRLTWAGMPDAPVLWRDAGPVKSLGAQSLRAALVRVRVAGTASTIVYQKQRRELAWSFYLGTLGDLRRPPQFIRIATGFDDPDRLGLPLINGEMSKCWGDPDTGCEFDAARVLNSHGLTAKRVCTPINEPVEHQTVFDVTAGGRHMLVRHVIEEASGGTATNLEIWPAGNRAQLCRADEDQ